VSEIEQLHQQHVFIGGLHRSGTSVFSRWLGSFPEISSFASTGVPEDEGQHLQSVFPPAWHYGGPGRFCFHPEAPLDAKSPLLTRDNILKLRNEWGNLWNKEKTILLEKSPPNLIHAPFLQAVFPDARFIFLLRHPVAVALATKQITGQPLDDLMKHWIRAHDILVVHQRMLDSSLCLHYESLVTIPDHVHSKVQDFTGVTGVPLSTSPFTDRNPDYFNIWQALRTGNTTAGMTEQLIHTHEFQCNRFGYSLEYPLDSYKDFSLRKSVEVQAKRDRIKTVHLKASFDSANDIA